LSNYSLIQRLECHRNLRRSASRHGGGPGIRGRGMRIAVGTCSRCIAGPVGQVIFANWLATTSAMSGKSPIHSSRRLVPGSRLVFTGDSGGSNPRLWSGHPVAVQIVLHQSVEKIPEHSVTNRRGLAFRQAFSQKTLGFCAIRVGSLVENSGTRTTFLLRSPKTEKEQPLTH
jgi:hypothetical protein